MSNRAKEQTLVVLMSAIISSTATYALFNINFTEFDRGFYWGIAGVLAAAVLIRLVHFVLKSIRTLQSDLRDLNDDFQMHKIDNAPTAEQVLEKYFECKTSDSKEQILKAMEEYRHKGKQAEPNW